MPTVIRWLSLIAAVGFVAACDSASSTTTAPRSSTTSTTLSTRSSATSTATALGWTTVASMPTGRGFVAAATGPDGRIYAMGGALGGSGAGNVNTVEAYTSGTNSWATIASMPRARFGLAAATGPDGRIYAIGGNYGTNIGTGNLNTVEAYTPATNSWATVASMPTARYGLAAATGLDGRIYAIGGDTASPGTSPGSGPLTTVEAYTPGTNSWATVAPMPTARLQLAAATGPDGRIYAIGGVNGGNGSPSLNTVEVYTPSTNSWATVASMPTARAGLAAATGPDGRIYAVGDTGSGNTAEAYTPGTNSWATVASMPTARGLLAAATGPDGRIYAIGGNHGSGVVNTVEAYDTKSAP
jgi:N-acetylneuraminic acid mutarotase